MFSVITLPHMSPNLIEWGPLVIRWYGLAYVGGLLFAVWYIKRLLVTPSLWGDRAPTMSPKQVDDMFVWMFLGVVAGGRLGYVLLYQPLKYLQHPLEIFHVWDGGMSFHGGFLGVVVACYFYGRRVGETLDKMLDLGAAATPVGLGLGRLANFVNGELFGRESDLPWAMIFPGQTEARHPSQLYEFLLEGVLLFVLVRIATHRFQALAHPGRASGIFALTYGLSRIIIEFFRVPDPFIGYYFGFITQGMIYSLPLVAVGVWLLLRSRLT
ncbi:prolipoprotein diacylglyceryl transferase [Aestuariivirga litoralis]|uniref:prolipoprotein diacylglyceryl transferase n=1 Tax=Aestuariivirga litoralis TaxID=2650924 RepID=UPI0018C7DA51|nr:prolipoprotein diacylglyceryl transferase [Aestuariivirga litoralis]MBG1230974.1 prolipoprotein diacylglyceryl transferase [Aestuariivirga litoralis]